MLLQQSVLILSLYVSHVKYVFNFLNFLCAARHNFCHDTPRYGTPLFTTGSWLQAGCDTEADK